VSILPGRRRQPASSVLARDRHTSRATLRPSRWPFARWSLQGSLSFTLFVSRHHGAHLRSATVKRPLSPTPLPANFLPLQHRDAQCPDEFPLQQQLGLQPGLRLAANEECPSCPPPPSLIQPRLQLHTGRADATAVSTLREGYRRLQTQRVSAECLSRIDIFARKTRPRAAHRTRTLFQQNEQRHERVDGA
jgi:hypothetical protein